MSKLIAAYIEITGKCNSKCPYCYNEKLVSTGKELPLDRLVDVFQELKAKGITDVALSGGEPFLYRQIRKLLDETKRIGINVAVISNGTCFSEYGLKILSSYQPNLQITFDGHNAMLHDNTRGNGNFQRITKGIKAARNAGYHGKISVRFNIHKSNNEHIAEFLDMISLNYDVDGKDFRDIDSIGMALVHRTEDDLGSFKDYLASDEYLNYPQIFSQFEEWNERHSAKITYDFNNPDIGCAYNAPAKDVRCGIRIALDGNVYPCQMFTDPKFSIGNILQEPLSDIMNGEKLSQFIDLVHSRRDRIDTCKTCAFKGVCAGGCPAQAYIENGTINSVTARCKSRKQHFGKAFSAILDEMKRKSPIVEISVNEDI